MNELKIKDYELPKIEIKDYEELLETVKNDCEKYKNYVVSETTLDSDTKKRAELNKMAKAIDDKRKEISNEISKPITEFKSKCDVLVKFYKDSSELLDIQIKKFETEEKNRKKNKIEEIFNSNVNELKEVLSLEKIFDDKWLNKGNWKEDGTFKLEKDLIDRINVIRNDLLTIGELNSKYEVELKNDYLNHFQLGEVIRKNNDLIQKEEILKKQQEETKKEIEHQREEKVEKMLETPVQQEVIDPIKTYTLRLTGKLSAMQQLKKFIEINNIKCEKVD